tara:strand:+ start:270 stop:698 length:429 start_codon:yes stop_codon:yes gene_type:complete
MKVFSDVNPPTSIEFSAQINLGYGKVMISESMQEFGATDNEIEAASEIWGHVMTVLTESLGHKGIMRTQPPQLISNITSCMVANDGPIGDQEDIQPQWRPMLAQAAMYVFAVYQQHYHTYDHLLSSKVKVVGLTHDLERSVN